MSYMPPPRQFESEANLKLEEQARRRDRDLRTEDTSGYVQRKRLSRRTVILIQLAVLLLIIIGLIIMYNVLH